MRLHVDPQEESELEEQETLVLSDEKEQWKLIFRSA